MGFIQRRVLKAVLYVVSFPKLTLAISALVLAASVTLAVSRLTISTDENKLFSSNVGFFKNYLDFIKKFPENEAIYVLVQSKDASHPPEATRWTRLADAITERLRQMPEYVLAVDSHVPLDQLGAQGILFDKPDLVHSHIRQAGELSQLAAIWGKPNAFTKLLSTPMERFLSAMALAPPEKAPGPFINALAGSWNYAIEHPDEPLRIGRGLPDLESLEGPPDPERLGYYYVNDEEDKHTPPQKVLLVRVYPKKNFSSLQANSKLVNTLRDTVMGVAKSYPEFTVGMTGRPTLEADELSTTDRDSRRAEIVALSVIFVGLVITLRSFWLALAAELCLAVGIGWSFGYATLARGELNLLSTVFLIALIGIGMDYLIQILAAYRREARRYVRPTAIWVRVFRHTGPPVITACLGAAGAFFVSVFTDFRGASDLGVIAGGGLLLCLLAGFTVLPALLVLFPTKHKTVISTARYAPPPRERGLLRLALPAAWLAAVSCGIPYALKTSFNPNLLDLQVQNLESVKLVRKLQTWSAVVLSKDLATLRAAQEALQNAPTIRNTESVIDAQDNYAWLQANKLPAIDWGTPDPIKPDDLQKLSNRAVTLADHFEKSSAASAALQLFGSKLNDTPAPEKVAARLSQWQVAFVNELQNLLSKLSPPPLDITKLPSELSGHFVSPDGNFALYIIPKTNLWQRDDLAAFVNEVESRLAKVPGSFVVTGIASNVYHSTSSIESSFYRAAAYALVLIFVLVLIDLRSIAQTLLAVSVLAFGLPMLVALMGYFHITWNFANFFALPILIGAGHEYGVFMVHRYKEIQHDHKRVWGRWDASDRALLLCAFVTCSSFGFFWFLGHHEGLKSLGLVMALGTACIYLATVTVLRPLLKWMIERQELYHRS